MKQEHIALAVLAAILVGLPLAIFGYQRLWRPAQTEHRVIDIQASVPERGGFSPESIRVAAGETVTLRFHSTDVTHSIAIGPGLGIDVGQIDPGHIEEVTVAFPEAGTYTFYCNTWCSDDHWRMRGVIRVEGDPHPTEPDPIIQALIDEGVDIDANLSHAGEAHTTDVHFERLPSAARGEDIIAELMVPADLQNPDWRLTHTPEEGLEALAAANLGADDPLLRDAIAALWVVDVAPETAELYNKNCAACHGQYGDGNGPAADTTAENPPAFADPTYLWRMRGDVLYAKIRRGGMGTDMPNFGTLFTQEETRALVDYLWTLSFSQASD
jgi:plastocyanin/mono/diheme cytochrome c family protein